MKKIRSWSILFCIFLSLSLSLSTPIFAASTNVLAGAEVTDTFGLASTGKYVPEHLWDGINVYVAEDPNTFCDFKLAASKNDILDGSALLYNVMGEVGKEDSVYFCTFKMTLDKVYTLDRFRIYLQTFANPASLDGFDLLVSETGEAGSWTKVYSAADLVCKSKLQNSISGDVETAFLEDSFAAVKAKYVVFGLTQTRCQDMEALYALDMVPNANPHYFRITELELFEAASEATTSPEVTTAPADTTAPVTTAPTQTPATADSCSSRTVMLFMAGTALLGIGMRRRKFHK